MHTKSPVDMKISGTNWLCIKLHTSDQWLPLIELNHNQFIDVAEGITIINKLAQPQSDADTLDVKTKSP